MQLIEVNGMRLLLDCGLYQGRRSDTYQRNRHFPFNPKIIDAVIISNARLNHSGNLPNLVKQGFKGPIYATPASVSLIHAMLTDLGTMQEADMLFVNKYRRSRGEKPSEALYTQAEASRVQAQLKSVPYHQEFSPVEGVTARLVDAGFMLGSASVDLQVSENGRKTRMWFSGDIGRRDKAILRDPVLPEGADILVMESTYGDPPQDGPQAGAAELEEVVRRTIGRGGKIVVPAFSIGQTQELIYGLNQIMSSNVVSRVPVYIDSPLVVDASKVFLEHTDCYDEESLALIRENRHPALNFEGLTYIRSLEESRALNERKEPMIIISATDTAENGRILHHIRNIIDDARSSILLISWQAPFTLGRRLAERSERIKIFGEVHYRRAEVATIRELAGHAGQALLAEYALSARDSARQVYLIHGEEKSAQALTERLGEAGMTNISYPDLHEGVEI